MDITTIASIIAALVTTITLIYTVRNSKGNITKRIERKQRQICDLEQRFCRTYGLNDDMSRHYGFQQKKEKLENDIDELKKRI